MSSEEEKPSSQTGAVTGADGATDGGADQRRAPGNAPASARNLSPKAPGLAFGTIIQDAPLALSVADARETAPEPAGEAAPETLCEAMLAALPLRRVLAENPGPLTGPGTTTWLVGQAEVTVIDPGPALPAHLEAILASLEPGERIAAILVTHPHLDHSALVPDLARRTGAPVYGFGPAGSGRSALMQEIAAAGIGGGEGIDHSFAPGIRLADGATFQIGTETFRALHTPGHSAEHLCFAWRGMLFCGDQVMAWAPSLVSLPDGDMGAYMEQLHRLLEESWTCLLPCHGEVITAPAARITALIEHRRRREAKLLAALTARPQTPDDLLPLVYADTPEALWPAARRNLLAHIADLTSRREVTTTAWPGPCPQVTAL